jgi:hypothetical protein
MKKIDFSDPMSMYKSGRTAKIVTEKELNLKKAQTEHSHQLAFCKWLKLQHPDVRFRSDIQSAGKLSPQMQNIKLIIDPWRAWPDIQIYHKVGNCCGLMIEMKRLDSGTFLKDGSLSSQKHVQEQAEMHQYLRTLGWSVCFAEGFDQAKRKFEEYINNL